MRVFVTAHDHYVLPGIHVVTMIDGRNFIRLTTKFHSFEALYVRLAVVVCLLLSPISCSVGSG